MDKSVAILPSYERFTDLLAEKLPHEILAFRLSEEEQELAQDLVDKNSAGTLTEEEASMLDQMAKLDSLVSLLKVKAMLVLRERS